MIPCKNYLSEDILELEKNLYFRNNFCISTCSDLLKWGDYKTVKYYFQPLTIRFFEEIKIFSNICLHRSGLIDIKDSGNSSFSCKYHGWSYDSNGRLIGTPFDSDKKSCSKRLDNIPAQVIDKFVFVDANDDLVTKFNLEPRVKDILGGEFFYREAMVHDCNWKLLVENVIEPYHISFVHNDTFVPMGLGTASNYEWSETSLGSYNILSANSDYEKFYSHYYIGSNLFVSSTNGLITFVSYFFPVSAAKTILYYELWESPKLIARPNYIRSKMRTQSIDFTKKVLLEDKEIIEAAQLGMNYTNHSHDLSQKIEPRVCSFHENYCIKMGF